MIKLETMVELSKKILTKVSFDPLLFQKELMKALRWITDRDDVRKLKEWCHLEFGKKYPSILAQAFA